MSPQQRQDQRAASLRSVLQTGLGLLGGVLLAFVLTVSVMDAAHLSFDGQVAAQAEERPVIRVDQPKLMTQVEAALPA